VTREQAKAALPIIQAFADGKTIQSTNGSGGWYDLDQPNEIYLINHPRDLRIKPEPREFWLVGGPSNMPWVVWHDKPDDVRGDRELIHVKEVL